MLGFQKIIDQMQEIIKDTINEEMETNTAPETKQLQEKIKKVLAEIKKINFFQVSLHTKAIFFGIKIQETGFFIEIGRAHV